MRSNKNVRSAGVETPHSGNQNQLANQANANTITVMMEMFTGIAFILLIALSMTMFGCGGESQSKQVRTVSETTESTPSPSQSPIGEEVTVVVPDVDTPSEAAVTELQPVSFADAEAAFNQHNYTEAVRLFKTYTEENAENAWGHYMYGLAAKRIGDYSSAEEAFNRALELDPKHSKSLLNLARVLIDDQRPEEALEKLDAALELDPESGTAFRLQGRAFHNLGWMDDARNAYREAILIDSTDAWSINNLALIDLEQERYEDALAALARTIELRDDVSIFYNNLGMALEHTGHIRDAEDAYGSAVAIDSTYEKALVNRDRVLMIDQPVDIEAADFEALAQVFIDQIREWNAEALAAENSMTEPVDGLTTIEADSPIVIDPDFE